MSGDRPASARSARGSTKRAATIPRLSIRITGSARRRSSKTRTRSCRKYQSTTISRASTRSSGATSNPRLAARPPAAVMARRISRRALSARRASPAAIERLHVRLARRARIHERAVLRAAEVGTRRQQRDHGEEDGCSHGVCSLGPVHDVPRSGSLRRARRRVKPPAWKTWSPGCGRRGGDRARRRTKGAGDHEGRRLKRRRAGSPRPSPRRTGGRR